MSNRRQYVPFDPFFFEKRRLKGENYSAEQVFSQIYQSNHWKGNDSVSGEGASRKQTAALEKELPALLLSLGVEVLLDLPCGEYSWMRSIDLPVKQYIGADIVPEIIALNRERFGSENHRFTILNVVRDPLPEVDLLLCRDCLVHLSHSDIRKAVVNIKKSSLPYLLATTFPDCEENEDITTGDWRPLNLQKAPFYFPEAVALIVENCSEGEGRYQDKSLGLWRLENITIQPECS